MKSQEWTELMQIMLIPKKECPQSYLQFQTFSFATKLIRDHIEGVVQSFDTYHGGTN